NFFFQAEDGIRDRNVTGVQTCALPILSILDNAATKIYFNPAESEIHVIASRIGDADLEELRLLRKGQCLVIGQFAQQDGKLGLPSYHVIDVPAIDSSERE